MTDLLSDVDTPSDAELISSVRGGDVAAYGELFSRHKDAANRLARQLVRGPDSDDLVAEAFAKVLSVLQGGGGPDVAFRAYLLTAVRRLHVDRIRAGKRLQTTDDLTPFDPGVPFQDTAVAGFESGAAAKAFASLPERWQLVLWHLEVEGNKPADIAPLLGMTANSVSALAYRAREGLRQAFLTMHLSDISETECRWVNEHLGAFVRQGLAKRDAGKVQGHLDTCRRCSAMYLELTEVNSNLAGIIAPLLLGAAAAGYLSSGGAGAAGLLGLVSRARDLVAANTTAVTAAGVAAGVTVATVAAVALGVVGRHQPDATADRPAVSATVPGPATARTSTPDAGSPSPAGPSAASPSATAATATVSASPSPAPAPAVTPSTLPASVPPAALPGDLPGDPPAPTDAPPAPVVGAPVVDPSGSVQVGVTNMRSGDVLDVTMTSADTTFAADPAALPAGCTATGPREVQCVPALATPAGGRTAAPPAGGTGDYTVTLPLVFPDSMVEDDLQVTATLGDAGTSQSVPFAFRPSRRPTYDVRLPVLTGPGGHALAGDLDRWTLTTSALLPPRVRGLRYEVSAPVRFRAVDGCEVGPAGSTLTCPDLRDGDEVTLPLEARALTTPVTAAVTVSSLVDFADADPADQTRQVRLSPGADLGLDLAVASGTPDPDGSVSLAGLVSGLRDGLDRATYRVGGGVGDRARFTADGNPSCTVTDTSMTCPAPPGGDVTLVLRADDRGTPTPVTVSVEPGAPFEAVGTGSHAADVTLPARPSYDFAMSDLTETAHTVAGDTDTYTLRSTVKAVPAGGGPLAFVLSPGARFAARQDGGCTVVDPGHVTCDDLSRARPVDFAVETTATAAHDVTVALQVPAAYDDPTPADDRGTVTGLRPGTRLSLTPRDLGTLHRGADANYPAGLGLGGVRHGVPSVTYRVDGAATFAAGTPGCVPSGDTMTCPGAVDGPQRLLLHAVDPTVPTPVTVSVRPDGDFVDLGDQGTATAVLGPTYDFAMTDLVRTGQTVTGDTDHYRLSASVGPLPPGVDQLVFALTEGGRFAPGQDAGCTRLDDSHVRCEGLGDGRAVEFRVDSTATGTHPATITFATPDGYDDPAPGDHSGTVSGLRPGIDLHLSALTPDAAPPADDADRHRVTTTLSGVRDGLASVTFTLTGDAAFAGSPGCTAAGATLTCADPSDGPVAFTLRSGDVHQARTVRIRVTAAAPFLELDGSDDAGSVVLAPRPSYPFALGTLTRTAQSVTGDTDHYTLRTTVDAPADSDGVVLALSDGGVLAAAQDTGCARLDDTHLRCGGGARTVDLAVDSTGTTAHPVTVALQVPARYDDPSADDNQRTLTVSPGVDLSLGATTPAVPVRGGDGSYEVSTVLRGVRSGPVTVTLGGTASVTAASCTLTGARTVSCTAPTEGQTVRLTLRPEQATAATPVTLHARAADPLVELADGDNTVATTLAPDVSVQSVSVADHTEDVARARVQVAGVPAGVSQVRLQLSGADVGTGSGQTHLTGGAGGADGEAAVDCFVSTADGKTTVPDGVWATCTNVTAASQGRFYVDLRLAHAHGTDHAVALTVVTTGVDQAGQSANDRFAVTFR